MMLEWSLHPQQTVETESMTAIRTSHKLLFKIYDRICDAPAERAALGLPPSQVLRGPADVGAAPVLGCLAGTSRMARRS
eukprot:5247800-Prymnesium_polylepis.1